jgi:sterol 3beta-glucosyltransferase
MNILILALGSRGDVLPYVTLAGALQQAGHKVRMVTFDFFGEMVASAGVELLSVQGDAEGLLRQAADGMLDTSSPSLANPFYLARVFRALQRSYGQLSRNLPDVLMDECILDTDLVLNQLPAHLFGEDLAEMLSRRVQRRIPWAILSVIPLARTVHQPLFGFQNLPDWMPVRIQHFYNLLTYRLGEQIGWQMFRHAVNAWRRAQGMPPQGFWGRYEAFSTPPAPGEPDNRPQILCGFSEQVVPRAADWGTKVHITGWWWPKNLHWFDPQLPAPPPAFYANPALEEFIRSGSPPVFIGLGSMPVSDPAQASALFIEAARLAGARLLLHSGWAGLSIPSSQADTIFPISYMPYDWLFPQMSLVIHHGGSGTTGYALASGVPSMVLPFAFDQFFWGRRTAELGVGPAPIPFARLTAPALAAAIRQVQQSVHFSLAAANLAVRLRAENGIQKAMDCIGALVAPAAR